MTPGRGCGILGVADIRRCGGMADTGDLKSPGSDTVPVRVRSPAPSGSSEYRGVEQLAARRAHNPEVAGSNPVPAIFYAQLAQLVEQRTENPRVSGSIPELGTNYVRMSFGKRRTRKTGRIRER